MASKRIKWNTSNEAMMHQLTAATVYPGYVCPYPVNALGDNMQTAMPGLSEAYVSAYCKTSAVRSDFTALGEFAVARTEGATAKGYNYAFGVSADGHVYYAGPFKGFPEHHWSTSQPTPVEKLFGHSAQYYSSGNSTRD